MRARHAIFIATSLLMLAACDPEERGYKDWSFLNPTKSGVLGAPPIAGMSYRTSTEQGLTGVDGGFNYRDGQQIVFSIGNITLPKVAAKPLIRLVDFDGGRETQRVRNIRRLLRTLDSDGDPANGITIDKAARDAAKNALVDFNQPTDAAFEANVANYLAQVKPGNPVLVTLEATAQPSTPASGAGGSGATPPVQQPASDDSGALPQPATPAETTSGTPTALEPPRRLIVNAPAIESNIVNEDGAGYVFAGEAGKTYVITVTPKTPADDPELFVFRTLEDMRSYWSVEAIGGVDSPEATALRVGISTHPAGTTEQVSFTAERTGDYYIMLIDLKNHGDSTIAVNEQP